MSVSGDSVNSFKEADLRKCLLEIQNNPNLDAREKAQRMQELMTQNFNLKRPSSRNSELSRSHSMAGNSRSPIRDDIEQELSVMVLTEDDLRVTFKDAHETQHGCTHYLTKAKFKAECCDGWYTCRFCHDDGQDHQVDRFSTRFMLCMLCKKPQKVGQDCAHCKERLANYYCDKCKLWDNDPEKSIYHCNDCGICRRGKAEDFIHCHRCSGCISKEHYPTHKCLEGTLMSDCPICGDNLFISTQPVRFMPCGHAIHFTCYQEHKKESFKCPVCQKSLENVEEYFARIDEHLRAQPMPEEYANFRAKILCNDCGKKCETSFHFLWHKCEYCKSFNTKLLCHYEAGNAPPVTETTASASNQ